MNFNTLTLIFMTKIKVFLSLTGKFLSQYIYAVKDMWCEEPKFYNLNWTSFTGENAEKNRDDFINKIIITPNNKI